MSLLKILLLILMALDIFAISYVRLKKPNIVVKNHKIDNTILYGNLSLLYGVLFGISLFV